MCGEEAPGFGDVKIGKEEFNPTKQDSSQPSDTRSSLAMSRLYPVRLGTSLRLVSPSCERFASLASATLLEFGKDTMRSMPLRMGTSKSNLDHCEEY